MFGNFVYRIYLIELEIKNTTYTLVCFIPCHTPRNWQWGPDKNKLCNKRDDFNYIIVNFPFICSNIPAAPLYGVYNYVLHRWLMLTGRRLSQGLLVFKLIWFTCYATYPCHRKLSSRISLQNRLFWLCRLPTVFILEIKKVEISRLNVEILDL
jgi:hypothetical protein